MKNQTMVTEFLLLGFSSSPKMRLILFGTFTVIYSITLAGNLTILTLIWLDAQLHTPMYFFLSNLSFVDIWYTTSTVPLMLVNLWSPRKTISFAGCGAQTCLVLSLGITECVLLAVMAYDRFLAICHPLHYTIIMNHRICVQFAALSWILGFFFAMVHTVQTLQMPYCGPNVINHFYCDILALLKLVCADIHLNEIIVIVVGVLVLLFPFTFILTTYIRILVAILKTRSSQGGHKAFSTCASHMTVVSMFYGSAMFLFMRPGSSHSSELDKLVSLFYSVIAPMFNPIIYSLRNKDVKSAFLRMMQRCKLTQRT